MSDVSYEFAVIGGGLIGSSAARHLSGSSGSVCLIGPEDNDETHGAWFDEGRLTRGVDNNPYWTALCEWGRRLKKIIAVSCIALGIV